METTDFTKQSLFRFLNYLTDKGLDNSNTVAGLKAAASKLLEELADTDDVTKVDAGTAVIRYNNRHPNELSPESLRQYRRRLAQAIDLFVLYKKDPTGFQPLGRGVPRANGGGEPSPAKRNKAQPKKPSEQKLNADHVATTQPATQTVPTLAMPYPLRADFLAQLVVPRDLTTEEAKRLCGFLMTLAADYRPQG